MNLGLNLGIGVGGGGSIFPPSKSDILYWPNANDGDVLEDKLYDGVEKYVTLDGTSSYIDTGISPAYGNDPYEVSVTFRIHNYSNGQKIFDGYYVNDDSLRIYIETSYVYISHNAENILLAKNHVDDGEWHTILMERVGDTFNAYLDTVKINGSGIDVSDNPIVAKPLSLKFGADSSTLGSFLEGDIKEASMSGYFTYTLNEGVGSTLADTSGEGNDGILSNCEWGTEDAVHPPFDILNVNVMESAGVNTSYGEMNEDIVLEEGDSVEVTFAVISNPDGANANFRGIIGGLEPLSTTGYGVKDDDAGNLMLQNSGVKTTAGSYFKVADGFHKVRFDVVSTSLTNVYIDDEFQEAWAANSVGMSMYWIGKQVGDPARNLNAQFNEIVIKRGETVLVSYGFCEGGGDRVYNRVVNDGIRDKNDVTLTSTSWEVAATGAISHNAKDGYSGYTDDTVTIAQYYNDSVCPVMVRQDDIQNRRGITDPYWANFFDNATLCNNHHIVPTTCAIIGYMDSEEFDWAASMSASMSANPLHLFNVHSWTHPAVWYDTDAERQLQYIYPKGQFINNPSIVLPDTHRYKGSNYLTSFMQWGGNMYDNGVDPAYSWPLSEEEHNSLNGIMSAADYLVNSAATTWTHINTQPWRVQWETENDMFLAWHGSTDPERVLDVDETYKADFTYAYNARGFYSLYTHPWNDGDWVLGANSVRWNEWAAYIGDRLDVWYTDYDSFINYKYLRDVNPPAISHEMVGDDFVVTVVGDPIARARYGLSTPLTYKINKPTAWGTDDTLCYYKDTGSYSLMTEKTASDYVTGIDYYRDDGSVVYVSQGLPQESDSFMIKVVRVI